MEVASIYIRFKYYRPGPGPCNALLKRLVKTQPWPGLQPSVERQERLVFLPLIKRVSRGSALQGSESWDGMGRLYTITPSSRFFFYTADAMVGKEKPFTWSALCWGSAMVASSLVASSM